jgi:hypothetical protein
VAGSDERSEIDKLLADVEGTLSGRATGGTDPAVRQGRTPAPPAESWRTRLADRRRVALVAALAAGGGVWLLFAFLPFLGAISGGLGAFLGTFLAVLLLRRR